MSPYERYEELLKKRGLKNSDVAKATGITNSVLSDWKRGKYQLKVDKLQLIADYLEVPLYELLGMAEDAVVDAPAYYMDENARDIAEFLHTHPEYKVLFDASRKVKPEDFYLVIAMIDRMTR